MSDLLEITSEPYGGRQAPAKLANDLVLATQDVADINRIIAPFLELFEPFFFEGLGRADCFESTCWKTARRRGSPSYSCSGPSQKRSHIIIGEQVESSSCRLFVSKGVQSGDCPRSTRP